jgi:hypothetical protein
MNLLADAMGGVHRPPRDRWQPRELLVALGAVEQVAGLRPPSGYLPDECDVDGDLLDGGLDAVGVKVATETVLADPHVGPAGGRLPALGGVGDELLVAAAVGEVDVDADGWSERIVRRGEILVHEHHHQTGPVVEVRVEVPPLVRSSPVVGACTVLPRRHDISLEVQPLVVGVLRCDHRERLGVVGFRKAHQCPLACCQRRNVSAA